MNHYELLRISRTATTEEISKAYRKLAAEYHPDTTKHDIKIATTKFKEITDAYEVLTTRRQQYDTSLHTPPKPKTDPNIGNVYTPSPPEFDIWGRRLTEAEKRQWIQDNSAIYPVWPMPSPHKPAAKQSPRGDDYFRDSVKNYEPDEVMDIR